MNYFVTIYTDPLLDYEGATHSFIGLTHKSPDDLENENPTWYKKIYPSINSTSKYCLISIFWKF